MPSELTNSLLGRLRDRAGTAGVVGLGYVGLPLAVATARAGFRVIGFDIDPQKPVQLNAGRSYIAAVKDTELAVHVSEERFVATSDFERLSECDVIVICVPTPLTRNREPDLSYVERTTREIATRLRTGQLVILESTTWPGTTREIVKPILEQSGLVSGRDFFLGFSPEREDPGNASFETVTIPKVVSGDGEDALLLVSAFYRDVVKTVVPVASLDTAEAVKITENIFRAVNIALVNELKLIYGAMGIDVWDVIDAAKTKPFGFMPFYPGPGLGGHCIPIDPFYLTWKSREFELPTRFIELAGEINHAMPRLVIETLAKALDAKAGRGLNTAQILMLGLAYKKNISDIRESPALKLMELLAKRGAKIDYHDPFVEIVPATREYSQFQGMQSVALNVDRLTRADAVLIATDHDAIDYALIAGHARLIVDTRNVMARNGFSGENIVKA